MVRTACGSGRVLLREPPATAGGSDRGRVNSADTLNRKSAEALGDVVELFEQSRFLRARRRSDLRAEFCDGLLKIGAVFFRNFVDGITSVQVFGHLLEKLADLRERGVGVRAARVELEILAVGHRFETHVAGQVAFALAGQWRLRGLPSHLLGQRKVAVLLLQLPEKVGADVPLPRRLAVDDLFGALRSPTLVRLLLQALDGNGRERTP